MSREKELIEGIRKGDIRQFETLFRSSYTPLVRYAKTIIKDQDTAEEIVQELFYKLWKDREKILINNSLDSYLYRSVHNRCLHHLDHVRVVHQHKKEMKNEDGDGVSSPVEILQHKELQGRISGILKKLPERCSTIFYMNRFDGLRYSEIASKLSITVKTVEANMGRALKEFRKALEEEK
jgi:RNA polymerase sigma-70 factor (ECF subfamily)